MREWFEDLNELMKLLVIGTVVLFAAGAVWLSYVTVFGPLDSRHWR